MISLCPFNSAGLKSSYLEIIHFLKDNGFSEAKADILGENLGIPRPKIITLEKNNAGNAEGLFRDVIVYWLDNLEPSWIKLADALGRSDYKTIADKILNSDMSFCTITTAIS